MDFWDQKDVDLSKWYFQKSMKLLDMISGDVTNEQIIIDEVVSNFC